MSFDFNPTSGLPGVIVISGQRFSDERGFFSESFRANEFEKHGIPLSDIRQGSPTFGKWVEIDLSSSNMRMVYVPPGYAHGFFAYGLQDAHVIYKVTEYYSPEHDRAIRANDPAIGIPLRDMKVSEKDLNAPLLKEAENNFFYTGE